MGGPLLKANLFVGSKTKKTMIEWLKVFKIVDNRSLVEEIKKSDEYIPYDSDESIDDNDLIIQCNQLLDLTSRFEELFDTLHKLNLKLAIDYMYQYNEFYIGRIVENVREDITHDIWFWEQYNITDVDIFAAMHSINATGLEYSTDEFY